MNIKISKEEFEKLLSYESDRGVIGSRLYGTQNEDSDTDILITYELPKEWSNIWFGHYTHHQFQYDCKESNTQYILTEVAQFYKNLIDGDSTINADVLMFDKDIDLSDEEKLSYLNSYKVIKAFLGFVKRDIKKWNGRNKKFHANRGLYTVSCLLKGELPKLEEIQRFGRGEGLLDKEGCEKLEKELREELNLLFQNKELSLYYVPKVEDTLFQKLLDSRNVTEFRYEQ